MYSATVVAVVTIRWVSRSSVMSLWRPSALYMQHYFCPSARAIQMTPITGPIFNGMSEWEEKEVVWGTLSQRPPYGSTLAYVTRLKLCKPTWEVQCLSGLMTAGQDPHQIYMAVCTLWHFGLLLPRWWYMDVVAFVCGCYAGDRCREL